MRALDTTDEAHRVQLETFRRMGPQGRLQKALELNDLSRKLLVAGVRRQYPEYSEQEIRQEVIRRLLPKEFFSEIVTHAGDLIAMMPEETLKVVIAHLEAAGIEYMITGSFASNLYGVPRTTQDADIVIEVSPTSLKQFVSLIEDEFYVAEEAAREALRRRDMFNIIHFRSAFKIDLVIRKQRPYAEEEFRRRQRVEFLEKECWFASPEDTILSKLEWSKKGQSERQYQDALGVAEMQGDDLNWHYLETWAERLGLADLHDRLVRDAGRE